MLKNKKFLAAWIGAALLAAVASMLLPGWNKARPNAASNTQDAANSRPAPQTPATFAPAETNAIERPDP